MTLQEIIAHTFARRTDRDTPSLYQWELAHDLAQAILGAARENNEAGSRKAPASRQLPPAAFGADVHEAGPTAIGGPPEVLRAQSRLAGYTGDACPSCGNFTMKQVGKCLGCDRCGASSGCS